MAWQQIICQKFVVFQVLEAFFEQKVNILSIQDFHKCDWWLFDSIKDFKDMHFKMKSILALS